MGQAVASVEQVEQLGRLVFDSDGLTAERHPVGFGNENWKLRDTDGSRYVLKIGDRASAAKWHSSHAALELAAAAGLRVPELVYLGGLDQRLVRIFSWIDGETASTVIPGSKQSMRLLRSTGEAVRALHSVGREAFSSRLDGSSPAFATWKSYIAHRLVQIRSRCEATGAVDATLLDRACALAADLADDVDGSAQAVLCHRDLHVGNLIVNSEGTLTGIIDWDAAEAWDRAGDWFKLEFDLLRVHPGGAEVLTTAYLDAEPTPPRWVERRRLVHLIESLNILPNAITQDWTADFSDRARIHLRELVGE